LTLGVCTALISMLPPLAVILVLCALIGLVYGPIAPIYNYVMQTRSPPQLRGRVVGVMTSLAYAAGPLGFMLAGPVTDAAGLRTTFLVLAIPMTVIGLVSLALPSLRELDRAPELVVDPKP
jgi:MFS family permease